MRKNAIFAPSYEITCRMRTAAAAAYRCGEEAYGGMYVCVVAAISDTSSGCEMRSDFVKGVKKRISHQVANACAAPQPTLLNTIPLVSGGFRCRQIDWR